MKLKHKLDDRDLKITYCYVTATNLEGYGLLPCLYEFTERRKRIKILASHSCMDTRWKLMDIIPDPPRPTYESTRKSEGDELSVLAEVAKDLK